MTEKRDIRKKAFPGSDVKIYSLAFAVFFVVCVLIYNVIFSRDMFRYGDGLMQQYPYYIYAGKWIRELLGNVFIRHQFELPMWDMTLYGFDPIVAFDFALFDPFNWISALVPMRFMEASFNIVIMLKYYTAGISFLYFCHFRRATGNYAVAASLVYVFSGIMTIGLFQANFLNIYYLFPLLIVGVDKLWDSGKFIHYTLSLAACTLYDYYFTYMMGLLVIVYCVIRFVFDDNRSLKGLFRQLRRFIVFTAIGIGLGLGPHIPELVNMAGLDRLDIKRPFQIFFTWKRNRGLIAGLFSYSYLEYESHFGISAVILPAVYCLIKKRKEHKGLLVKLFIYYAALFIAPIGSLFNGGNYAVDRYVFGFALIGSYVFLVASQYFDTLTDKEWKILMIISLIFLVPVVFVDELYAITSGLSAVITVFLLRLIYTSKRVQKEKMIFLPVLFSCAVIGFTYGMLGTAVNSVEFGKATDLLTRLDGKELVLKADDRTTVRYDKLTSYNGRFVSNSSMIAGINGYDFYHSNYSSVMEQYFDDLGLIGDSVAFSYRGLHGRNFLELLNGSKYLTVQEGLTYNPCYSYHEDPSFGTSDGYSLFVSDVDTSLVFFYDDTIAYDSFMEADPVSREEIMMNYMVMSDGTVRQDTDLTVESVPFEQIESYGISITGDRLSVTDPGAYVILRFEDISDSEVYLRVKGLYNIPEANLDSQIYQLTPYLYKDGEVKAMDAFVSMNPNVSAYHYRYEWVFNFNPYNGEADTMMILFDTPGEYTFDGFEIYKRSIGSVDNVVLGFEDHADIDNVYYELNGNHITADINGETERYLYFAVPYSQGWSAEIDGEPAEIICANIAFMAVRVPSGEHSIELSYKTPYLYEGIALTVSSAVCLCMITVTTRIIRKKQEKEIKHD